MATRTDIAEAYQRHGVGFPQENILAVSLGEALKARARTSGVELNDVLAADVDRRLREILVHLDKCVVQFGTLDSILP